MTQDERKVMFRRHINTRLDYFCKIHNFNGDITDLQVFIWGLEPRGPNTNTNSGYGESIQDLMEKNGHIDLLNNLLKNAGKERDTRAENQQDKKPM